MRAYLFLALQLLGGARVAIAHYVFSKVSHNGGPISKPWQYIRNVSFIEYGWYTGNFVPYYDIYDENIRCGRGASLHGPGVETLVVDAGDELAFYPTHLDDNNEEAGVLVYHFGAGQAYLSKAPTDLESYTGDGDWFKIGSITSSDGKNWDLFDKNSMNFTIPKTTPPGKYLMRVEQVFPLSSRWNETQFYLNCAHVEVKGPGGGTPGPMVKFPGAYDIWDREIWAPYTVSMPSLLSLTGEMAPGPKVWTG